MSAFAQTGTAANRVSEATVTEQTFVTLSGEDSTDPHFQAISYQWQQLSGEPVTLSSTSDVDISFTTPQVDPHQTKDLKFSLIVTNP